MFAALGDETRLDLLARLAASGPRTISQLSAPSSVSRQAITKHLEALEKAGLVLSDRRGRERFWKLEAGRLEDAHGYLDTIARQWDEALLRLKSLVEK